MQLHADRSEKALMRGSELNWVPSPLNGVDRRMLEREGDEVARATTIVRYAPGSYFSAHTHTGGEEFLVLEGVFSDEHGDFPAGTYVRNPVGSSHTPHSKDGCVILVKLWQMPPADQEWVRANMFDDSHYQQIQPGVSKLTLHATDHETVEVWKLEKGTVLDAGIFDGGFEAFILEGTANIAGERLDERDWLRLPKGSPVQAASEEGTRIFVKHGHLAKALPLPTV